MKKLRMVIFTRNEAEVIATSDSLTYLTCSVSRSVKFPQSWQSNVAIF